MSENATPIVVRIEIPPPIAERVRVLATASGRSLHETVADLAEIALDEVEPADLTPVGEET